MPRPLTCLLAIQGAVSSHSNSKALQPGGQHGTNSKVIEEVLGSFMFWVSTKGGQKVYEHVWTIYCPLVLANIAIQNCHLNPACFPMNSMVIVPILWMLPEGPHLFVFRGSHLLRRRKRHHFAILFHVPASLRRHQTWLENPRTKWSMFQPCLMTPEAS